MRSAAPLPLLTLLLGGPALGAVDPRPCSGSVAVGTFHLRVRLAIGGDPLPIRAVNNITAGSRIQYQPIDLPQGLKDDGRLTLVVAPADGSPGIRVLELRSPATPGEWTVPFRAGVVLLVLGPQGLDERRVTNLVSGQGELVNELAGYAEQTAEIEDTIETLTAMEEEHDREDQFGRLAYGTPSEQALYALVRAVNPAASGFNPLGAGRRVGPTTTKGKAADAFFENAGDFVPGGGALPLMKSWLFPDNEFRSVYAQTAAQDGIALCAQRQFVKTRNRIVYLWAYRVLNEPAPPVTLAAPVSIPMGMRAPVPVKTGTTMEWRLLNRVREWYLVNASGTRVRVPVRPSLRPDLEIDLRNSSLPAGAYRMEGAWDWDTVRVDGQVRLDPLGDLQRARPTAASAMRLAEQSGPVEVELEGADFQFVEKVTLRRAGALGVQPVNVEFRLPKGPRAGAQSSMHVVLDTGRLRPGPYLLAMAQTGGVTQDAPVDVLARPPEIRGLPLRVNLGEERQRLLLNGEGLDRLQAVESDQATIQLEPASTPGERAINVSLKPGAKQGDLITLRLKMGAAGEMSVVRDGLLVAGPKPKLISAKSAPPENLPVALRDKELPAGSFVVFDLRGENIELPATLHLTCEDPTRTLHPLALRVGETREQGKVDAIESGVLFASFDPGTVGRSGCELKAAAESDAAGRSAPIPLGRVVRLPLIESLKLTNERSGAGYVAVLTGRNLETIEKAGWDALTGLPVEAPPRTSAGEGDLQTLRIAIPWPSPEPASPLYLWLRGDKEGRATRVAAAAR